MKGGTDIAIILGGGLSGLSAAYHSGFPIYEKRNRPGGTADTICKEGFVFDLGIHVLQSKDRYFLEFLQKLNVSLVEQDRNGWIYSNGKYSLYPFQVNTSKLPFAQRIRCVLGFLFRKQAKVENYEDWIIQNFGRGFADTFFVPYAEKFWGVPPKEMTYEWTEQRVPQPKIADVAKGMFRDLETSLGTHVQFQYPSQPGAGFAAISQALASKIENAYYGKKATAIDPQKKQIFFNGDATAQSYEYLLSSIPLPELIRLFPDPPTEIKTAIDQLNYNSIATVNLGIDNPQISDKHWVHFPEKDISFFRISFPSNFCPGLSPQGRCSIQAEVSYDRENPPEKKGLLEQVHSDLINVGVLSQDDHIVFSDTIFQKYGYVIYDHNRKEAVNKIHDYLRALDIYPMGRYGCWEYLWSDQSVISGRNAAQKLIREILNKT